MPAAGLHEDARFHRKHEFDYSRHGGNLKRGIAPRFIAPSIMDTLPSNFRNRHMHAHTEDVTIAIIKEGHALILR